MYIYFNLFTIAQLCTIIWNV